MTRTLPPYQRQQPMWPDARRELLCRLIAEGVPPSKCAEPLNQLPGKRITKLRQITGQMARLDIRLSAEHRRAAMSAASRERRARGAAPPPAPPPPVDLPPVVVIEPTPELADAALLSRHAKALSALRAKRVDPFDVAKRVGLPAREVLRLQGELRRGMHA